MPAMFTRFFIAKCLLVLATLLSVGAASAKDYKVEVIVFQNLTESLAHESHQYREMDEMSSEALAWRLEPTMLLEEYTSLAESEDYRLLHYFSWGQESLPISEAAVLNVIEVELKGWIKVYARQLLFVNLDLDFNGYRLSEKRRIKLDEKHFFDHPKFGVLMQVSRLEVPEEPAETEAAGEEGAVDLIPAGPEAEIPERDFILPGESIERSDELPQESDLQ